MKKIRSLDDHSNKLINKILHSGSYEEVKRYLLTAIKSLEKHNIHEHLVGRVIDKILNELHRLSSSDIESQSILNVRYAKMQLELIKKNRYNKADHVQT
jgi:hypothetical protein